MTENKPTDFIRDPRLYVQVYVKQNNITVTPNGGVFSQKAKSSKEVFSTLYLDYIKDVQAYNATEREKAAGKRLMCREYSDKLMTMVFYEYISLVQVDAKEKLKERLACQQEDLTLLQQFTEAVTGAQNPADVATLAHWMWLVKSKINNRVPTYHIMPVFYGLQGGGKTRAIRGLLGPLEDYKLNISLDQMTDERNYGTMENNYVIFFDEMERADKVDMDSLKKQITIDYNDYRPLHTNTIQKAKQSCSFIGATNKPLNEQIVDYTGMRRFWQLDCLGVLNWDVVNNINYAEMWRGIDENREHGYLLAEMEAIKEKQLKLTQKDEFELFIQEKGLEIIDNLYQEVDNKILYADYKIWAQDNGFKGQNSNWFSIRMNGKGIHNHISHSGGYKNLWKVSSRYVASFNNGPEPKHLKSVK